ncbi:hypothetical protein [Dactylosporangium salmoneum]|uniref:Uncharacterized protein n=1 Tax=Dactylosporangium salmoneum TaxID=53361 RepID=A0ABN3FZU0_9ACTN
MSSDFAFWKRVDGDYGEIFDALAEGDASGLLSSEDVTRFREGLIAQWPDIVNVLEPSSTRYPELTSKYVLLTLSQRFLQYLDEIFDMAEQNGLVGYSGVAGEPFIPEVNG